MTKERASEIVQELFKTDKRKGADLFDHFIDYFKIDREDRIEMCQWAVLCGFLIAVDAEKI